MFNYIKRWFRRRQVFCDHLYKYEGYSVLMTSDQTPVVKGVIYYVCYFCKKPMKQDDVRLIEYK